MLVELSLANRIEDATRTVESGRNIVAAHVRRYGKDAPIVESVRAILRRHEAALAALKAEAVTA